MSESEVEFEPKLNATLPPRYYKKRAKQHINVPLHFIGRKAASKFLEVETGTKLKIIVPDAVREAAEGDKPLLVVANHRSWMDIPFFVEATEEAGIHHTRPLSKLGNIQKSRALAWGYHQVGLFAADKRKEHLDTEGIDLVFSAMYRRRQNGLIFPEGTRVEEDIEQINEYARTPAMMAMKYGFRIVNLAIVGGGMGETNPSRHEIKGKRIPVANMPLALFGDEVIDLEYLPDLTDRQLTRPAGIATRELLKPTLQATLDAAYAAREQFILAA